MTAMVVGLVAVTPAAGYISPLSGIALGAIAAIPSYFAVQWRARTRLDDSLDVVSAHGVGGVIGALMTGVLAQKAWGAPADGALFGNPAQLGIQAVAVLSAIAFTAVMTAGVLQLVRAAMGLRTAVPDESVGLDVTQHGEEAYGREDGAILVLSKRRAPERPPADTLGPSLSMQGDRS